MKHLLRYLGISTTHVDRESRDVREFQKKFGHITNDTPTHLTRRKLMERIQCMQEELNEFTEAVADQDLAAQADALVDLVYFAKGTANMLGLPWDALWADVHDANMAKVAGVGPRGHKVDCIKPVDWVGPQTLEILEDAGYVRTNFTSIYPWDDKINEERCCDDQ